MDPGTIDQEREIKQLIRKAEDTGSPTHPIRKDCLKKLIEVAHANEASLKKLAAENIPKFYKVFPELEEDAINAIYDLCEDPEPKVRVDGYSAIVHLSKEQRKWVKRNADVLVQLLQADEPDEVASVKKALSSHVDLDPQVTFGVLCEQLVPQEESADEDERAARDHLRSLVLNYMTGDVLRIQRHASKAENENVLVDGLFKAIMSVGEKERRIIVKEILLCLPSLKPRSPDHVNDELLSRLLTRCRPLLEADMKPQLHACVFSEHTQILLELAVFICAELDKAVANPSRLMRFFTETILPPGIDKFAANTKIFFITLLGETWAACETTIDERERDWIRQYVTVCASNLLPGLNIVRPTDARTWKATETLLSLCLNRLDKTPWKLNSSAHTTHEDLLRLLEDKEYEESLKDVDAPAVRDLVKRLCERYQPYSGPPSRREIKREARRRRSPSPTSSQKRKAEVPLPDSDRSRPASRPRRSPSPRRRSPSPRRRSPSPARQSPPPSRRRSLTPPPRRRSPSPPPRRRAPTPPSVPLSIRGQSARDRERDAPPHLRGQPPSQPRNMPPTGPRGAQDSNGLKRRERSPDRGRGRSPTPPKRLRMHSPPRERGRDRGTDNNRDRERDTRARELPPHVPRGPAAAARDNGRPPPASTSRRSPSPPRAPAPAASSGSGAVTGWSIKGAATREPLPPQSLLTRMANLSDPEPKRRNRRGGRNNKR